ncbi:hypothetical protein BX666DRAFT_1892542 [Dichotomocladium elegans]|nr:hypothetical protein BX666DRAFT_1892542 [Dichotomocladium elegans]
MYASQVLSFLLIFAVIDSTVRKSLSVHHTIPRTTTSIYEKANRRNSIARISIARIPVSCHAPHTKEMFAVLKRMNCYNG